MDYLYSRLEYAEFPTDTPEREAFAKHLKLVAKALHDIEWVDSGDYGPGDEDAAIRACLTGIYQATLDAAVAKERERCAKLCEEWASVRSPDHGGLALLNVAERIRGA